MLGYAFLSAGLAAPAQTYQHMVKSYEKYPVGIFWLLNTGILCFFSKAHEAEFGMHDVGIRTSNAKTAACH